MEGAAAGAFLWSESTCWRESGWRLEGSCSVAPSEESNGVCRQSSGRTALASLSDVYSLPIHSQQLAVEGPLRPSSVRGAAAEGFCLYGMKEGRKEGSRWNDGRKEVGDVCTLALYVSILLTLVSSNRLFV